MFNVRVGLQSSVGQADNGVDFLSSRKVDYDEEWATISVLVGSVWGCLDIG